MTDTCWLLLFYDAVLTSETELRGTWVKSYYISDNKLSQTFSAVMLLHILHDHGCNK